MNLSRRSLALSLTAFVAMPKRLLAATKHPSLLKLEAALLADGCETATAYVHQDTLSVETMRRDPDGQKWHSLCRRTNAAPEDIDDRRIKLIVDIERRIWDRHLSNATDARSPA